MKLHELSDNHGATRARKRVGRGIGSGVGKTAGRGHKGQKSRSGVAIKGFEGGQMPLTRRLPKRGFRNPHAKHFNEVNLGRVQQALDAGLLDAKDTVTADALYEARVIGSMRDGVRLLGNGELKAKVNFEVDGASKSAIAAVEKAGGSVKIKEIKVLEADEKKRAKSRAKKAKNQPAKSGGGGE